MKIGCMIWPSLGEYLGIPVEPSRVKSAIKICLPTFFVEILNPSLLFRLICDNKMQKSKKNYERNFEILVKYFVGQTIIVR